MEEEEQIKIRKIITTVDDEKTYSIDVDENITFYEFKKILAGSAHLLKNCFRVFYKEQEYTNEYDDNRIQEMFPNLDPVPLRIFSNLDINEDEEELISVIFNITVPCEIHMEKYKMLYCFTCKKSICFECFQEGHREHKVEEKADYLAPAQLLMSKIFANSSLYKADSRLSKYMDCVTFRSNLKVNIFDNLRKLINDLEIKIASCLEFFSTTENETERNTNENIELMKKYCIECFIKLKNDINTKGIMIDDKIFLTFYYKLKEIEKYKNEKFEANKKKYEKLNTLLAPFVKQIEKVSDELKMVFDNYLNKDIYENFKSSIQENIVEKIGKEQVNDLMFQNIGVPRKSLNRMSLGEFNPYTKRSLNKYISPDKVLNNQQREKNPFQRAINTPQQKGFVSENLFGNKGISIFQNSAKQNISLNTYTKNDEQKIIGSRLPKISEKNDINLKNDESGIYENKKVVTTSTTTNINNMNTNNISGIGGNITVTGNRTVKNSNTNIVTNLNNITSTDTGMQNLSNNNAFTTNLDINKNSNISSNVNNLKTTTVNNSGQVSSMNNFGVSGNTQNLEKETTTTTIYTQQVGYPKQTQYTKKDINDAQSQIQKNITKTETTITSINTNNLMGQNRGINSKTNINTNALNSMNIIKTLKTNKNVNSNATNTINSNISSNNINSNVNNLNKNYSQGYGVTKFEKTTIVNKQNTQQSGEQQTGMFQEKLVDVLNNEITKNELEYQEKMKNRDINIETHTPYLYEQNHIMIQGQNLFQTFEYAPSMFLFMYPIFKTNKIVGAIEDESTGKVQVNFKQAFEDKDIQLNEFPQGGAFCNYDKNLYFTGGQETQKGVGKLFLGVSISEKDLTARLVKFPSMIFSHWNHSMISNGKYVFSIGGYNSNKCEYFNLKAFKWVALPDLNSEERQRPMLFIYKDYLYAFMGYTQFSILDSVERININKLSTSKWEKVSISNPENINLKFYGAGTYFLDGILYFVGGKIGQGNDDSDMQGCILFCTGKLQQ